MYRKSEREKERRERAEKKEGSERDLQCLVIDVVEYLSRVSSLYRPTIRCFINWISQLRLLTFVVTSKEERLQSPREIDGNYTKGRVAIRLFSAMCE